MLNCFLEFNDQLKNDKIRIIDAKINKIFLDYSFLHIREELDFNKNQILYKNIKLSPVVIIYQCEKVDSNENDSYFILSFQRTLLIINQSQLNLLNSLFSVNSDIKFCFLTDCQDIFKQIIKEENNNFEKSDDIFKTEISNFIQRITFRKSSPKSIYSKVLSIIKSCIAGYLIKQSYSKLNTKPEFDFSKKSTEITNDVISEENDFVVLRNIGTGSMFRVDLIYHFEKEELFAIKKPFEFLKEHEELLDREINNYKILNYPLLPKFHGFIIKVQNV